MRGIGSTCLVLVVATTICVLFIAPRLDLDVPLILGVPTLYLAYVTVRTEAAKNAHEVRRAEVADQLAESARLWWEREARTRRLHDPHVLAVSWRPAGTDLVEDWPLIVETASRWRGRSGRCGKGSSCLARSDGSLADTLASVPTRRLVVLGASGSGKTMLLVGLVRQLLDPARRPPGGVVPVLFPLAWWDPVTESLTDWLHNRLLADYPTLAAPFPTAAGTITRGQALLANGLILPVLDGFDELPARVRGRALDAINAALGDGDGLVLSSRLAEYRAAVAAGWPLPRATAGVLLDHVGAAAARDYLLRDAGGPAQAARWRPVIDVLGTTHPAASALRTPLTIDLARTIFNSPVEPRPSPCALLDTAKLPTADAVEAYLFDAFVPAAYRRRLGTDRWTVRQAQRHLTFLARHPSGLEWWKLAARGPQPVQGLRWSLDGFRRWAGLALALGLVVGLVAGPLFGPIVAISGALGMTLVLSLTRVVAARPMDLDVAHGPRSMVARDRGMVIAFGAVIGPLLGSAVGLIVGLTVGPATVVHGPRIGLVTGAVVGPIAIVCYTATCGWRAGPWFGVIVGLVDWLLSWQLGRVLLGVGGQVTSGLLVGLVAGTLYGLHKAAWGRYLVARCRLAVRGQLPWRLMSFLEDAHRRGVLRQVGSAYQFRHLRLRQRLAERPDPRP